MYFVLLGNDRYVNCVAMAGNDKSALCKFREWQSLLCNGWKWQICTLKKMGSNKSVLFNGRSRQICTLQWQEMTDLYFAMAEVDRSVLCNDRIWQICTLQWQEMTNLYFAIVGNDKIWILKRLEMTTLAPGLDWFLDQNKEVQIEASFQSFSPLRQHQAELPENCYCLIERHRENRGEHENNKRGNNTDIPTRGEIIYNLSFSFYNFYRVYYICTRNIL